MSCDEDGDGGVTPAARFAIFLEEDCPTPASSSVSFQSTSSGTEMATAEIVVTDVSDVYAASLHLIYFHPAVKVTVSEGAFLNSDGSETELLINDDTPGILIIEISRKNVSTGVDAAGSEILLNLTFEHRDAAGRTGLTISNNQLLDASTPPQEIPGVSWCSGSVSIRQI
jgi:hypothetical protein